MNKPILFVNSISKSVIGNENNVIFDSRRVIKSLKLHRLDDILGFLYLNKRPFVTIICENAIYYGEVFSLDKNYIFLKINFDVLKVNINNIKDIKINYLN